MEMKYWTVIKNINRRVSVIFIPINFLIIFLAPSLLAAISLAIKVSVPRDWIILRIEKILIMTIQLPYSSFPIFLYKTGNVIIAKTFEKPLAVTNKEKFFK